MKPDTQSSQAYLDHGKSPHIPSVIRVRNLPYHDFVEQYCKPRTPVVLTDAITSWPALSKWSPQFFKSRYGTTEILIRISPYSSETRSSSEDQHYQLGDLITLIEDSTERAPAPYLRNQALWQISPELDQDLRPRPDYFFPNWIEGPFTRRLRARLDYDGPELHIGGRGASFPSLHFDYHCVNTFLAQIYGQKKVIFFSPSQSHLLYPEKVFHHGSLIPDIDHADLTRFPLFAQAVPTIVTVNPGELLYIPAGWWHTTRLPSASITVSFEHANDSNWSDLTRECCYMVPTFPAMKSTLYLKILRILRLSLGR